MANGQKGKASKRKLDMREESKKLAGQIGDRIRELRESIKGGDGNPITQPAFYDFIFDKPEYQQSTDDYNEPKPENSKQTEISNIEGGKDINLALLCLISDKCGVSLDYLIRGKEYQPSAPTCPPEGKDASPAGDNVVESQIEKDSSAETGSANLPPEEKAENGPYTDYLSYSPYDICKALAALSFIADLDIKQDYDGEGRLGQRGVTITIKPKEIILPVIQSEGKILLINELLEKGGFDSNDFLEKGFSRYNIAHYLRYPQVNGDEIPSNWYALHFIDKRVNGILRFIKYNSAFLSSDPLSYTESERSKLILCSSNSIGLSMNHGINCTDFLDNEKMRKYDNIISRLFEPFSSFANRARTMYVYGEE